MARFASILRDPGRAASNRRRVTLGETALMPIGIGSWPVAGSVELFHLLGRKRPADRAEIVAQLLFVAGADDDAGYGRALQQPIQGNLRDGSARFIGDVVEGIHDLVQIVVVDLWAGVAGLVQPACLRQRLAAADLTGEPAPAE